MDNKFSNFMNTHLNNKLSLIQEQIQNIIERFEKWNYLEKSDNERFELHLNSYITLIIN